jgi:hypothetical protein
MFGAVFLAATSEVCRAGSPESQVWPDVVKVIPGDSELRRKMFPGGQPSTALKAAIRAAVNRLQLRHAIDKAGTQEYFETVKLQFGFTWRGGSRRLAEWLVGQGVPYSVRWLRGIDGHDLASHSFQAFWSVLQRYRREVIDDADAERALADTPWIRKPWIKDILIQARARRDTLGDSEPGDAVPPAQTTVDLDWPFQIGLSWEGSKPKLEFRLDQDRHIADGIDTDVDFQIDNRTVARWLRQRDGWTGPTTIESPTVNPRLLRVVTRDGVRQEFDITQTALADEIVVFRLSDGSMLDASTALYPDRDYALLYDNDLKLAGLQTPSIPCGARRLHRLSRPWPEDIRLMLDDLVFWEPRIRDRAPVEQVKLVLRTLGEDPVPLGFSAHLVVLGVPAETHSVELEIGSQRKRWSEGVSSGKPQTPSDSRLNWRSAVAGSESDFEGQGPSELFVRVSICV